MRYPFRLSWMQLLSWLYAILMFSTFASTSLGVDAVEGNGTKMMTNAAVKISTQQKHGLPSPLAWRNRPVYIKADEEGTSTRILNGDDSASMEDDDGSLPLGMPIPFESDLFKGRILFRIKNVASPSSDSAGYFEGKKQLWQCIVQGRFKAPVAMHELYTGEVYDQPLANLPAPNIMRMVGTFINMMVPGIQFDITSQDRPKVLALYGGAAQSMRKDLPGAEPDIRSFDIDEETTLIHSPTKSSSPSTNGSSRSGRERAFHSVSARKRNLSHPKHAAKYVYDTDHVYTLDQYNQIFDYGTYTANFGPSIVVDMTETLNGQPMTIGAVTEDGRWMFRFKVFHERQLSQESL